MMKNLDCLPFDVIDYIFNCDALSYIDICRLSSVSKFFNCITRSNKLWKKKYFQTWPEFVRLYVAAHWHIDWQNEFRFRMGIKKSISKKLSEFSAEYYHYENISNEAFLYFKDISRDHLLGYEIVIDELEAVINHPQSYLNLTQKYYALKVLRYMRHAQLETKWKTFLSQPSNNISFVEGACLISEWCKPTAPKCSSQVLVQIEDLVKLILEKIKQCYPNHPVLKHKTLKEDRIFLSLWSSQQCKDILHCINAVMFQDLNFIEVSANDCTDCCAFIDEVLKIKSGFGMALAVIYSAVAAKLGVCCELIEFPVNFVLRWLEKPELDEKHRYTFIDIMNKGTLKTFTDMFSEFLSDDSYPGSTFESFWIEPLAPRKTFIKWAWFLVEQGRLKTLGQDPLPLNNALELICFLSPDDLEHKLLLARLFMHLKINITQAISMLQEIAAANPEAPLMHGYMYQTTLLTLQEQRISPLNIKMKCQRRTESTNVKFAVGMIMRHKMFGFRCVIYGWDHICNASEGWIRKMNLMDRSQQPFYYVLVGDNTKRYAAEENLEIDTENEPITHVRIGKYFESFHGSYYLPNEQTLAEYPDDIRAREEALRKQEENSNPGVSYNQS